MTPLALTRAVRPIMPTNHATVTNCTKSLCRHVVPSMWSLGGPAAVLAQSWLPEEVTTQT